MIVGRKRAGRTNSLKRLEVGYTVSREVVNRNRAENYELRDTVFVVKSCVCEDYFCDRVWEGTGDGVLF